MYMKNHVITTTSESKNNARATLIALIATRYTILYTILDCFEITHIDNDSDRDTQIITNFMQMSYMA